MSCIYAALAAVGSQHVALTFPSPPSRHAAARAGTTCKACSAAVHPAPQLLSKGLLLDNARRCHPHARANLARRHRRFASTSRTCAASLQPWKADAEAATRYAQPFIFTIPGARLTSHSAYSISHELSQILTAPLFPRQSCKYPYNALVHHHPNTLQLAKHEGLFAKSQS
jgi:hypothetical protein